MVSTDKKAGGMGNKYQRVIVSSCNTNGSRNLIGRRELYGVMLLTYYGFKYKLPNP